MTLADLTPALVYLVDERNTLRDQVQSITRRAVERRTFEDRIRQKLEAENAQLRLELEVVKGEARRLGRDVVDLRTSPPRPITD